MADVTKTYEQLPRATDAPEGALIALQMPGGPLQVIPLQQLLSVLLAGLTTDVVAAFFDGLPDETNPAAVLPAPGSGQFYLSGGVLKRA